MSRYLPEDELILLYRRTVRPLYAYVSLRVGGDRDLAEDIVQDTWMRALDSWPHRGLPQEPLAWLKQVAHNVLVSHFRRHRPLSVDPALLDLGDERFSPDTPDTAALVNWGFARMRRRQVGLLEAFHFEGKTIAEIAVESGVSERAVEGRLRRARAVLRRKLAPILRRPVESGGRAVTGGQKDARQTRTR